MPTIDFLLLLLLLLLLAGARGAPEPNPPSYFAVVPCDAAMLDRQPPHLRHEVGGPECVAVWHGPLEPGALEAALADEHPGAELLPDTLLEAQDAQLHAPPDHRTVEAWTTHCRTNHPGAPGRERGYAGGAFAWGVDRLDGSAVLDARFCSRYTGAGVDVYVVDTGVAPHDTFRLPVRQGFSSYVPGGVPDPADPDPNGHGTHVAGLAASAVYGVAPDAQVTAVQVLGPSGSGPTSGIVAGLLWIAGDRAGRAGTHPGCVINLSLGGFSRGTETERRLYARLRDEFACVVVVAAGNACVDACTFKPALFAETVTVGATDPTDGLVRTSTWGSNYGPCVTLSAPGLGIVSAYGPDLSWVLKSGTSMASPLAAGVAAALYEEHLAAGGRPTGTGVRATLLARATPAVRNAPATGTSRLLVQLVPTSGVPAQAGYGAVPADLEVLYIGLGVLTVAVWLLL